VLLLLLGGAGIVGGAGTVTVGGAGAGASCMPIDSSALLICCGAHCVIASSWRLFCWTFSAGAGGWCQLSLQHCWFVCGTLSCC